MKTVELNLKNREEKVKVHLRLTCGGQLKLKDKYEDSIITVILDAMDDIEKCIDVLETALNHRDNDNVITDGAELYDMLVDNDYSGAAEFGKVLLDVAVASGIIRKDQANSLLNTISRTYEEAFKNIDELEIKENALNTPTEQ